MSWEFETVSTPKARKDYHCDASDWISNYGEDEFTPEEWGIIQKAKLEKNKILKGTKYHKVTGKWEGEFSTFRARIDLNKICMANDIYEE